MSDDTTAPEIQDTPTDSAPPEGHAQPDDTSVINWEQRYNDLRPKFDQTAQEAADLRDVVEALNDPSTRDLALQALGVEFEDEDDDEDLGEYIDPAVEQRIQQLEQQLSQRDQQAEIEAEAEAVSEYVADQVGELQEAGVDITDQEVHILVARALQMPDHDGLPDVQAAWQELSGIYDQRLSSWAKSKRTPQVPDGQSASKQYDLSTEQGRREAFAAGLSQLDD